YANPPRHDYAAAGAFDPTVRPGPGTRRRDSKRPLKATVMR
ncbi:MAG: hypothetical protein QOD72_507, partial [Acidimicrobiaceae bacterium]|nr:hypothetical protein [Acidimicrobiaceae bacterium]